MPAVVRVKRRIDEEPHSAFVLNGKKRRTDGNNAGGSTDTTQAKDDISTVLKFAGTISKQDNAATKEIATRITKDSAKQLVQQKTTNRQQQHTNVTERVRRELRQAQTEQRFRVVNCHRTTLNEEESLAGATSNSSSTNTDKENNAQQSTSSKEASSSSAVTIVDIEPAAAGDAESSSQSADAGAHTLPSDLPADSDTGYVYDLYIPENEEEAAYVDLMDNYYLSLHDNLTPEDCFKNEDPDDDDEYDSEDSNQENYFTNEYPDEDYLNDYDTFDQGYDQDLSSAIGNFRLDDDDDVDYSNEVSSSDNFDDIEGYVHIFKPKNVQDNDDDDDDCEDFGNYYDRYHKRILNEINVDDIKEAENHAGVGINDGGDKNGKEKSNSPIDQQKILKEHKEYNN